MTPEEKERRVSLIASQIHREYFDPAGRAVNPFGDIHALAQRILDHLLKVEQPASMHRIPIEMQDERLLEEGRITVIRALTGDDNATPMIKTQYSEGLPLIDAVGMLAFAQATVFDDYGRANGDDEDD